ncbi:MAG: rRNA pseudouridine synthase [Bacteroidales bacterium]|nr:rRNA pseudouridine synthase [Bacteroidales bacterium]
MACLCRLHRTRRLQQLPAGRHRSRTMACTAQLPLARPPQPRHRRRQPCPPVGAEQPSRSQPNVRPCLPPRRQSHLMAQVHAARNTPAPCRPSGRTPQQTRIRCQFSIQNAILKTIMEQNNNNKSHRRPRIAKPDADQKKPFSGHGRKNGPARNTEANPADRKSRFSKPTRHADDAAKTPKTKKQPPQRKPKTPPPSPKPYDGTIRLNKYIANAGICSRREADKLIAAGSVSVNGKVITEMGYQVHEGDVVNYGGETLHSERKRYFLLNKPKGFITTVDDPQERQTVMMLIDGACPERIYPVGRLDRNTTGLLLFTNDGDLARHLTHPSTGVYKIYQVELDKAVTRDDMRKMIEGIELEDGPVHVDDIQYVQTANDKRVVGVELHSGKNRIVRRIFEHLGYKVHKLDRVVFAGLTKKDLPRGRYRELTEKEVGFLKMI